MFKHIFFIILTVSLTGSFLVSGVQAGKTSSDKTPINVAVAAPGNAKTPISSKNLPIYLDEDLASKHADFSNFAKSKVTALNRNHRLSRSRMQIVKQPDGSYRARFHTIDNDSLVCKVRRSKSKSVPFVGVLSFKEKIFEAIAISPEACRKAEFIPVAVIPNRHIFSYKKGRWQ